MNTAAAKPSDEEKAARRLAFHSSWKRTVLDLVILALSGMYFTLAFPGIGFDFAAWTGLIPLIALCAFRSPKRAFWYGLTYGYFWNLTCCFFLREIMIFIPFIFGFVLGAFTAVFAAAIPFVCHYMLYPKEIRDGGFAARNGFYRFHPLAEIGCVITLSAWWVVTEWIRSWIFTGFPWNLVSTTQWENTNFIQICEFTGIYGVSFLVVMLNFAAFFAIRGLRYSIPLGKYKRPWAFLLAVTLCLFNAWLGGKTYETWKKAYSPANVRYASIGVVQPHLSLRRDAGRSLSQEALDVCVMLSQKLIADDRFLRSGAAAEISALAGMSPDSVQPDTPDMLRDVLPLDLIVWPESAVPVPYYFSGEVAENYRREVRTMMQQSNIPFLTGTITADNVVSPTQYDLFNSALLLRNKPAIPGNPFYDTDSCYSKVHLVPFGEFIPLNDRFPKMGELVGMGRNLTPGKGFFPLRIKENVKAGVLICYEDVFPYAARRQANANADFLLVITNDAWYPTSYEPEQHYANSIFRAIETRLPMVRCGNSDYSVLIDWRGNTIDSVFRKQTPEGDSIPDPGQKGAGAGKFIVPLLKKARPTFYTLYGDVFVLFCGLLTLAGFSVAFWQKYDFRKRFAASFEDDREKLRQDFLNSEKR